MSRPASGPTGRTRGRPPIIPALAHGATRASVTVEVAAWPAVARRRELNERLLDATCAFTEDGGTFTFTADDLARYPDLYADKVRDAVAERFAIDRECVTTGAGSDDVLDSAFRAACGPGASPAYASPPFSMVEPLARMNGMRARAVPWVEALERPASLLEDDPAVVYVCRPNNPTGELAPREWLERLLDARDPDDPANFEPAVTAERLLR